MAWLSGVAYANLMSRSLRSSPVLRHRTEKKSIVTLVGRFNVRWDIVNGMRSFSDRMSVPRITSSNGEDIDSTCPQH